MEQIELIRYTANGNWLWRAVAEQEQEQTTLTYRWGKQGGAQQEKLSVYSAGKQGRNAFEQAVKEMQHDAELKIRTKGYERVENEPPSSSAKRQKTDQSPLPMLADKYEDHEDKIAEDEPLIVQPKLDGIRCLAHLPTGKLFSRQRKPIDRLPHIEQAVLELGQLAQFKAVEWLDGELYVHGLAFQDIQRLVRGADPEKETRYHVYDCVLDKPFSERSQAIAGLADQHELVHLVPSQPATKSQVDAMLQKWLDDKYEGCMVRCGQKGYELNKRSSSLLKCKRFDQAEFTIVELEPQKRCADKLGAFVLQLDDDSGTTFNAGCGADLSASAKQELWDNRVDCVGKIATVKFFERHKSGIPRFPKVRGLRHPDDM